MLLVQQKILQGKVDTSSGRNPSFSYKICHRAAKVLAAFCRMERGGGSGGMLVMWPFCSGLTSQKSTVATLCDVVDVGNCLGGRHLVDIIGDISWTKGVTSRGHFW